MIDPKTKYLPKAKFHEHTIALLKYKGKPIELRDYPHSKILLDINAREVMFKGGRQIAKSFTLALKIVGRGMIPYKQALYVAPSIPQSKVFSVAKIKDRIDDSPEFKERFINKHCKRDVFERSFRSFGRVYFRAASQLDNVRGISAEDLYFDEYADISSEATTVIQEVTSGQKDIMIFKAGTPKSVQNHMETDWRDSAQLIPVIKCESGHYNVPSVDLIEPDGLKCKKCKAKLSVREPYLQFHLAGKKDSHRVGIWVPQIILPLHIEDPIKYLELYRKKCEYSSEHFLNEIMGESAGTGMVTLSESDLMKCCRNPYEFDPMLTGLRPDSGINRLYAGVDWAITNKVSFTVLVIGGWDKNTNRFKIVYINKYIEPDPLKVLIHMSFTIKKFGVKFVVADWGAGHYANARLEELLGQKVLRVMYTGDQKKIYWDEADKYYKASRTRTLIDTIMGIKSQRFHFPRWGWFSQHAPHFTAEYAEESQDSRGNVIIRFDHPSNKPDDIFQATNIVYQVFKNAEDPHGQVFGRAA